MSTTKTKTSNGWKAQGRAWHKVTPPSGMQGMELRIPALTELIRNEAVPERLRAIALKAAAHPASLRGVMADELRKANEEEKTDGEVIADDSALKQAIDDVVEIQKRLIVDSVRVNGVHLTLEDLEDPEFPAPDAEWLGAVMLREADYDARGVRLGIEPLDAWARFRHFHDCGPSCGSCAALQDEFSTADLGLV
jgi:hypothetical protein